MTRIGSAIAPATASAWVFVTITLATAVQVHIHNTVPRLSDQGLLMDAHDGSTTQFDGPGKPFYYYAMGYGTCRENGVGADGICGQLSNNTVGVWSSTTLASGSWRLEHQFMPSRDGWPNCTYYRSHAVRRRVYSTELQTYNDTYVLFLNGQGGHDNDCTACPQGSKGKCILAGTSNSPSGPFVYRGVVPLRYTDEGGIGDFDVFADVDSTQGEMEKPAPAYVIYKRSGAAPAPFSHRMTLQRLDDTYLGVVENASVGMFGVPFVEAPALFRRKGIYYAFFGKCCAFCAQGTGIGVYSAPNALGPWTYNENIGCNATVQDDCGCGVPTPQALEPKGATCPSATAPSRPHAVTFAQQNSVIKVASVTPNEEQFVWTGDRWQSACSETCRQQGVPAGPVDLNCTKAWDFQYWSVLRWDDTLSPPLPHQVQWEDSFSMNVDALSTVS